MKYYKIIFGDWTETVGRQTNKTNMMKDARTYCRMWNIPEGIKEIQEITQEEYERRMRQ